MGTRTKNFELARMVGVGKIYNHTRLPFQTFQVAEFRAVV